MKGELPKMKVRIVNMPVRIKGERYLPGTELDIGETLYKSIKSNCIIIDENVPVVNDEDDIKDVVVEKDLTEDQVIMNTSKYKSTSKDDIMLKLAEDGKEFDPNKDKIELFKMLGSD